MINRVKERINSFKDHLISSKIFFEEAIKKDENELEELKMKLDILKKRPRKKKKKIGENIKKPRSSFSEIKEMLSHQKLTKGRNLKKFKRKRNSKILKKFLSPSKKRFSILSPKRKNTYQRNWKKIQTPKKFHFRSLKKKLKISKSRKNIRSRRATVKNKENSLRAKSLNRKIENCLSRERLDLKKNYEETMEKLRFKEAFRNINEIRNLVSNAQKSN